MISVLLLGFDSAGQAVTPGDAVRTLASFVPPTVDGLVRDLCLAGPAGDVALAQVADHAGCGYVRSADGAEALRLGGQSLRCSFVLVAGCGLILDRPVADELTSLLPTLDAEPPAYVVKAVRLDLVGRLLPSSARTAAVLVPRLSLQASRAKTLEQLARHKGPKRTLKARAWLAG